MKSILVLLACTGLLLVVLLRERRKERSERQARQREFLRLEAARQRRIVADAYAGYVKPRVKEDVVFQTEYGSRFGVTVKASCPEEAAIIMEAKYCTVPR